jgi:hypothetical protein
MSLLLVVLLRASSGSSSYFRGESFFSSSSSGSQALGKSDIRAGLASYLSRDSSNFYLDGLM